MNAVFFSNQCLIRGFRVNPPPLHKTVKLPVNNICYNCSNRIASSVTGALLESLIRVKKMSVPSESDHSPHLEITSLGGLRFSLGGKPLEALTSRPAQALLVYLARRGEPASRILLAELIWPERAPENALGNLRVTLHRLRSLLGDLLEGQHELVWLKGESVCLDVAVLEERLFEDQLEQAVDLYKGDFLAGFYLGGSRAFEDWQAEEAECLRGEVLSACQRLVYQHTEAGAYEKAIQYAKHLLELDPFHEPAQRQLMRLLTLTGQRGAALAGFERYRKLLGEKAGTEPDPATVELYTQVKAGLIRPEPASMEWKAPVKVGLSAEEPALPHPANVLVGRQDELAYLQAQLANPDCRLLTLVGPGGIGKTRLAQEAARLQEVRFTDGIFFAALAGVADDEAFLLQLSQTLRFSPLAAGDLFQQVQQFLQNKTMLIVLDNFEQLLPKGEQAWEKEAENAVRLISRLLKSAPALKLLVTSRERLRLEEEWLLPLRGLGLTSEAAAFFAQAAQRLQPGFHLAGSLAEVNEICSLTGGAPLALEMAAAWTPLLSCRQIADKIRENLDFLSNQRLDAPDRQRSVRALFEYSWRSLSLEEKRLFSWLSVFHGGGRLEEVLAVTGADPGLLLRLADKSLIQVDSLGHYDLHELMRQYARERLQAAGELPEAARRHFETYLELAERADGKLRQAGQEEWLSRLEAERQNLAAALDWGFYHQPDPHLPARLALALGWFWRIRSHTWDAHHWLDQALGLEGLEAAERAALLIFAGMVSWMQGDFACARQHLEESRKLWGSTSDHLGLAYSLHHLGMTSFQQDEFAQARDYLQSSLELFTEQGDEWGRAFSLGWLGKSYDALGEPDQAEAASQECLVIYRKIGDRFGLALFLSNEAWRLLKNGELEQARGLAEEACVLRREIGHQHSLAEALSMLGEIAAKSGEREKARDYYRQAQAIYDNLGNLHYVEELERVIEELGS
jgi:predicted ATPase/DNA-binding SARP family transcriptional activator